MTRYVRFAAGSGSAYGILEGETVRQIRGGLLDSPTEAGTTHKLAGLKMLAPCQPGKIVAVGRNYRSHLGNRTHPQHPEIFYKPLSSLQDPGGPIVIPPDATEVHYEGELVLVMGQRVKDVSKENALAAIFGATCGNDVTERNWQYGEGKDVQWWRAKGSDTFAPVGPVVVTGLNYDDLLLQTRLNGEVVQKERTADFIFDCATMVSWISRWVTLMPGDLVFTGTPGATRRLAPGDAVEVEIEGIGVLRNPVS
ncbi:MAG: fumarylacetoacetate hydrolase family protein [Acidobacteriia bacterium]|nr:fumarylacetoacetate hydrolase family protein [Terriglobia bacterium]